jgi:hypothetical protein
MQDFRYVRLFSDASGESHFQDIAVSSDRELSVPPAPPLRMRALGRAVTVALVGGDSGWHGEVAHPVPFRMLQSARTRRRPDQCGLNGTSAESVRRSLRRARS